VAASGRQDGEDLPPGLDRAALIAAMRRRDPRALREAYRRTFANELGRLVLADILATAGIGMVRGKDIAPDQRSYHDGRHDLAVEIMNSSGFDQASAVVMTMTDDLQGAEHDFTDDDRADEDFFA
jgi:hypothetical protein